MVEFLKKILAKAGMFVSNCWGWSRKKVKGGRRRFKKMPFVFKAIIVYAMVLAVFVGVFVWRAGRYYPEIPLGKEERLEDMYMLDNLPEELNEEPSEEVIEPKDISDEFIRQGEGLNPQTDGSATGDAATNQEQGNVGDGEIQQIGGGVTVEMPTPEWPVIGSGSEQVAVGFGEYLTAETRSGEFAWMHEGIDVLASEGEEVMAVWAGEVTAVNDPDLAYGSSVLIEHANGYESFYGSIQNMQVHVGQQIEQGAVVGEVGQMAILDSNLEQPYLHFEIRQNGRAKDPLKYLPVSR